MTSLIKNEKPILILLFFFVISIIVYFFFNPIIIDNNYNIKQENQDLIENKTVKILNNLNFSNINTYKAILYIKDRVDLSSNIQDGKILKTDDIETIKQIKDNWEFNYLNRDIATVENELLIYENDSLIYRTYIVLDKSKNSNLLGIQNSEYGWLSSNTDILEQCSKFKRVYFPIIFL